MKTASPDSPKSIERDRIIFHAYSQGNNERAPRFETAFLCDQCSLEFFFILDEKLIFDFPNQIIRRITCGVCYYECEIAVFKKLGDM